jgi:hypothetical protein
MSDQTLASSVPGIYTAFYSLVSAAANEETQVAVMPFELAQYEPAAYIVIGGIKGPRYEWESIGYYAQKEIYTIFGFVSVFLGGATPTAPETVAASVAETFGIFERCVMQQVITNRDEPILGTTGPSPYLVLPEEVDFAAGVGLIDGGPGGWQTQLDWVFRFEALLTPEAVPLQTKGRLPTSPTLETS